MPARPQALRRARKPNVVEVSAVMSCVSPVEKAWKLQAQAFALRATIAAAVGQKSVLGVPTFKDPTIGSLPAKPPWPWTWSANSDQNAATSAGEPVGSDGPSTASKLIGPRAVRSENQLPNHCAAAVPVATVIPGSPTCATTCDPGQALRKAVTWEVAAVMLEAVSGTTTSRGHAGAATRICEAESVPSTKTPSLLEETVRVSASRSALMQRIYAPCAALACWIERSLQGLPARRAARDRPPSIPRLGEPTLGADPRA